MNNENNKIALVTGATGGIGKASAESLCEAGFRIAIHYRSSDEKAEELKSKLPGSFLIKADLSTTEGVDHVYDLLKKEGGVDVLVNNAGMTADGPFDASKVRGF